jgi:deaminated glutathione amidase
MSFNLVMAQLESTSDKLVNLKKAECALESATNLHQAEIVIFPEIFMSHFSADTPQDIIRQDAESIDGPFVTAMQRLAHRFGTWLVFGMRETTENQDDDRVYNTTVIVSSDGSIVSTYRKTHLYDAFGYKESQNIKPGDSLFKPVSTPFGKLGLFVCYELRFPEIARYQAMHGADIIIVPSGWVRGPMKEHHLSNLVTTRAIENTVFMVTCDQVSDFYCGRSLIVDPMGVAIASGPESEALIPCTIDLERIETVRTKLPSYHHRRAELYHA